MNDNKTLLLRAAEWQMRRRQTRGPWGRRLTVVLSVVGLTAGTGVAFAAWTSSGTGTAGAKSASISFTVDTLGSTAPTVLVHPGSVAGGSGATLGGDLIVTLKNNSGFPVTIKSVAQGAGTITATGGANATTCNANGTGVSLPTTDVSAQAITVPSDNADHDYRIQNVVAMSNSSDTGCQGSSFAVPVSVTVTS